MAEQTDRQRSFEIHPGGHRLHPEALMLGYSYHPLLSEAAVRAQVGVTDGLIRLSIGMGGCRRSDRRLDAGTGNAGLKRHRMEDRPDAASKSR